jgi:hypothetical protein
MDRDIVERVVISNLEVIAYQSAEMIQSPQPNTYYGDFYKLYTEQRYYLATLEWSEIEEQALVERLPALAQPLLTNKLVLVLIPAVLFLITPFNWIIFPVYLTLLAAVYYGMKRRNINQLRDINQIANRLLLKLKVKKV